VKRKLSLSSAQNWKKREENDGSVKKLKGWWLEEVLNLCEASIKLLTPSAYVHITRAFTIMDFYGV
jgi:hypothetical protein